eukprot:5918215-Amphidinium_carterae.2
MEKVLPTESSTHLTNARLHQAGVAHPGRWAFIDQQRQRQTQQHSTEEQGSMGFSIHDQPLPELATNTLPQFLLRH